MLLKNYRGKLSLDENYKTAVQYSLQIGNIEVDTKQEMNNSSSLSLREPTAEDVSTVFTRLLNAYGPRKWWPASKGGKFEIICGAILVQNTAWRNAEKALKSMYKSQIWDWQTLFETDEDTIAGVIRSSGYYRVKARKLKSFAAVVMEDFGGNLEELLKIQMPDLREKLLTIWGIGDETADDIILYAAEQPSFVIDKYTMRIVDRLGWKVEGNGYKHYQLLFTKRIQADADLFNEYHALLDRHASLVCRTKPACEICRISDMCAFFNANNAGKRE